MSLAVAGLAGERAERCGACGATGFHEPLRLGPALLVECVACGVVRLYERVAAAHVGALYAGYHAGEDPAPDLLERQLRNPTFRHRARRLEAHSPPRWRTLLEMGCGDGNFLAYLRRRGWEVQGAEVDAEGAAAARRRHRLAIVDAGSEEIPGREGGWPALAAYHVLEHVYEPAAWLASARAALRQHGVLHLQVPNWASLTRRLAGGAWASLVFPQHVHFFAPETLSALLERSGFEVASLTTWDPWHGPGAVGGSVAARLRRGAVEAEWAVPARPSPSVPARRPRLARRVLDALAVPLARAEALAGRGAVVDVIARRR